MFRKSSSRTLLSVACVVALAGCAAPRVATNPPIDLARDAEHWNPGAQMRLGHALLTGKGVEKDPEAARYWLGQAAAKGDAPALRMLGLMHLRGDGVPRDPVAAREKLTLAAERSDAVAQGALGAIYLRAEGVERDLGAATYWIMRAAEQGEPIAQTILGQMYLKGDVVKPLGGAAGSTTAKSTSGFINSEGAPGASVEPDYANAVLWLRRAAEQGVVPAQMTLGQLYLRGRGVVENKVTAYQWFQIAADAGDPDGARMREQVAGAMSGDELAQARAQAAPLAKSISARRPLP